MIFLQVTMKNGSKVERKVENFIIAEGALTYWIAKTNEEIGLDMDDIEEISALAVPVAA